jgi:hypothetical protein
MATKADTVKMVGSIVISVASIAGGVCLFVLGDDDLETKLYAGALCLSGAGVVGLPSIFDALRKRSSK